MYRAITFSMKDLFHFIGSTLSTFNVYPMMAGAENDVDCIVANVVGWYTGEAPEFENIYVSVEENFFQDQTLLNRYVGEIPLLEDQYALAHIAMEILTRVHREIGHIEGIAEIMQEMPGIEIKYGTVMIFVSDR